MNKSYKSYAFLLATVVAIATPVRAMENQVEVSTQQQTEAESCEQQSAVWYKKRANQVAAGIAVLAAAYALAVYMDKIGLFAAEICPQVADGIVPADANNQKTEIDAPKTDVLAVDPSPQINVDKESNVVSDLAKVADSLPMVDVDNAPQFVDEKIDEIDGGNKENDGAIVTSGQQEGSGTVTSQAALEQLKAAFALFFKTPADENPATEDLFRSQYE